MTGLSAPAARVATSSHRTASAVRADEGADAADRPDESAASTASAADGAALTWRVHPAARRPVAAGVALVIIGAFGFLSGTLMQSAGWSVIAALILIYPCRTFFFPVRFRLDDTKIERRTPFGSRELAWADVASLELGRHGGRLSRRGRPGRFDPRAIELRFDGPDGADPAMLERIRGLAARHGVAAASSTASSTSPSTSPASSTSTAAASSPANTSATNRPADAAESAS